MNNPIKKNGIYNNIIFYLKIWIKVYPQFIFLLMLAVPCSIIGVYTAINLPKIIVEGIEYKMAVETVLKIFLVTSVGMIVAKGISTYILMKLMEKGTIAKAHLNASMIFKKIFNLNYQSLLEVETQNKIAKVKEIMGEGDRGVMHQFGKNIVVLGTSLFGIIFFAIDIINIDLNLLVIIGVTAVINTLYGIWANKYQSRNIELRSNEVKKLNYICDISQKRDFLKDIRIYKMENWIIENFELYRKKWLQYILKSEKVNFGAISINAFMLCFRDIFVYFYLVIRVLNGEIDISYFVFMLGLVMAFSKWINEIINQINLLISFSVAIDHIKDFLDMEEVKNCIEISPEVKEAPEIEFRSVSYKYPNSQKWIFKDFNLKISSGEKLALVGVNGAGKTTLMLLLMGLLEANEGEILIDGHDSKTFNRTDYYSLFSPVFQDINIFPESIYANVAGSLSYDRDKVQNTIDSSGMGKFVGSLPDKGDTFLIKTSREKAVDLSGGQNQRMFLARALYKNGKINILDEPTSALDPIAESRIYEEYNEMSINKTSIFISHRLASTKFCDRIILLEYGKIMEEGDHDTLMEKDGKYKELFEIQSKYYKEGGIHFAS
ncbi:ABC transporter ATP-binding protein [Alkaliphilus transvaalensis]|uniref:ABC transporter ATP-binding protein n=1 Tax=Alkaliphilus transvaalensis TaxID=114628 RepID=UPI00047A06FC|nr:ABC transporter ATP-binding protein [Alkaliphilus transvaalensis]